MLKDEEDISNYLGVNIKKKSDETFKLLQSQLVGKFINQVGLEVSANIKARETPAGKLLMRTEGYSLRIKFVCNYREAVGMLIYIQV